MFVAFSQNIFVWMTFGQITLRIYMVPLEKWFVNNFNQTHLSYCACFPVLGFVPKILIMQPTRSHSHSVCQKSTPGAFCVACWCKACPRASSFDAGSLLSLHGEIWPRESAPACAFRVRVIVIRVRVRVTHFPLFAVERLHCNELKTPCVEPRWTRTPLASAVNAKSLGTNFWRTQIETVLM